MAVKCGDCRYFVKGAFLGSYCSYKRNLGVHYSSYSADMAFQNDPVCDNFESAEFCCRDCSYCHSEWCNEHKESVRYSKPACSDFFRKGDNGSDTPSGSCFLTSACVGYMGKPDDCEELTALRAFRDGYVKKTESGRVLVDEYYRIAPEIVKKIDASPKREDYYAWIYGEITGCIALIHGGDNESALVRYEAMVKRLREEFAL